jgi:ketosteroid isomerase-like protein
MAVATETAKRYIDAFRTLDGELFTSLKTPDCEHLFAPKSLNMPVSNNNAEFADHMTSLRRVLRGFSVYIKELWANGSQITVWATSETLFREEAMDTSIPQETWSFRGEYIFILEMNEKGDKIKRVVEFLDSKLTEELRELMKRARKNLNKDQ